MAIRNLPQSLKDALIANNPFNTFHLVKFEKPSNKKESDSALDFVYLTDAPHDVEWDGQTYRPGSLLKVGAIEEATQAKASNSNLVLSAAKLGAYAVSTITNNTSTAKGSTGTFTTSIDLFKSGFYPGDTIVLSSRSTSNVHNVRIDKLKSSGTEVEYTALDDAGFPTVLSTAFDIEYANPEVSGLIPNTASLSYSNYVNRSVDIYKIYSNPTTGEWYHTDPIFFFKGIISKSSISDKASGEAAITWNLTSHWADFVGVQGRLTSDEYHRALDASGFSSE